MRKKFSELVEAGRTKKGKYATETGQDFGLFQLVYPFGYNRLVFQICVASAATFFGPTSIINCA